MASYEHGELAKGIVAVDMPPPDAAKFAEWVKADAHLAFLRENARAEDIVVYASGDFTFLHSLVVPNRRLSRADHNDLLAWSLNAYHSIASYVHGGGTKKVRIERGLRSTGSETLDGATQLMFGRTFEGWQGPGRNNLELHQEYAHLADIHWREEEQAYCRFDDNGDMDPIVSVTNREDSGEEMSLVTFRWGPLEEYLVASNSSLVRMFDLTLIDRDAFGGWSESPEETVEEGDDLFYRRKIDGPRAAYTRGVQIVRSRRAAKAVHKGIVDGWFGRKDKKYVEFTAHDWRNDRIVKISTEPGASTNYFDAKDNNLPFELSPAFFRPEVLSKYKTDRDKYTVTERGVTCRSAWSLKGIDVNDAGQVHAYICDLRSLPHAEQLHWLSYNEEPKTGISQRAVKTDFEGTFSDIPNSLGKLKGILHRWDSDKASWWTLRGQKLIDHLNTPLTSSRDEWAQTFMDLSQLVVEGFNTDPIRAKLDQENIAYTKEERTIALLEKLLYKSSPGPRMEGLRLVQHLRNKTKGHIGGSDAAMLARQAQKEHKSFANHFRHVCQMVVDDLEAAERLFVQQA